MRIVNANGTIAIVTDINIADLKEAQKVYDRKGNEVYSIRKAGANETGSISKHGAVLNGDVDGKAAYILIKGEGFDYDKFKENMAPAIETFYSAEQVVVEGLQVYNRRVSRMWSELEGTDEPVDCEPCHGTCAPEVDEDDYSDELCTDVETQDAENVTE